MGDSIYKKLKRVRKPRVHITYEVETDGAQELRELPFVVGVLGDYTGNNPANPLKPLAERKFIQIDRDNFNAVMDKMSPGLKFKVDNTLTGGDSEMGVELNFKSMEDFEPARIVENIPSLRNLMETRNKLRDLMSKADISPGLEGVLEQVLQNTEDRDRLADELDINASADKDDDKPQKDDDKPQEDKTQ